jgi:hypothetical protein
MIYNTRAREWFPSRYRGDIMKKTMKKLVLAKETVRDLTSLNPQGVGGRAETEDATICYGTCYTCSYCCTEMT